jgi:membrane glycosyltransferase
MVRGIHMYNMFLSGTDFWGGTWIRRTTPFREACVLTPLMPLPCMHGLTELLLRSIDGGKVVMLTN